MLTALLLAAIVAVMVAGAVAPGDHGPQPDWRKKHKRVLTAARKRQIKSLVKEAKVKLNKRFGSRDLEPDIDRMAAGDFEYFYYYYTGKGLQPKQIEFLHSTINNRHTIFIACRQSGKTECQAIAAAFALIFTQGIIIQSYAPTEKQAKDVVFARLVKLFKSHQDLWDMVAQGGYHKSGKLELVNESEFHIQTASDTSNIRGVSPDIIQIDESADVPSGKYWQDIRPAGGATKGLMAEHIMAMLDLEEHELEYLQGESGELVRIWETGTPKGQNHFWESYQANAGEVVIEQPWWTTQVVSRREVQIAKQEMSLRDFQQEYECVFNTNDEHAFPREQVIAACVMDPLAQYSRDPMKKYVMGVDLGQVKDHTVAIVLEINGPILTQVALQRYPLNRPWPEIVSQLHEVYAYWRPDLCVVDRTGPVGKEVFFGYLIHLGWNIEGWKQNNESKGEMMSNLELLLQDEEIELFDDHTLKVEFFSVRRIVTQMAGLVKYPKPDEEKGVKDDIVNAVGFAAVAADFIKGKPRIAEKVSLEAIRLSDGFNQLGVDMQKISVPMERVAGPGQAHSSGIRGDSPWAQDRVVSPWTDPSGTTFGDPNQKPWRKDRYRGR
jgi:hypothetical protein